MDPTRFDSLTRALIASRRATLAGFAAGAVAWLASGANPAPAACKKVGRNCLRNSDCCDGAKCKGGANSKCRCKSGFDDCDGNGRCEPLDADNANCGACGVACSSGTTCCDSACVDLQADRNHCGSCGAACQVDDVCFEGFCVRCLADSVPCGNDCCRPDDCCDGVCADLQTDRDNCGSCGNVCPAFCRRNEDGIGICSLGCCVDGQCADLSIDRENCGECGNECTPGFTCISGRCVLT